MKRTEETLRSMIREELQQIKKTMRDELAQKIMEEVCKKALIEARVTDVKVEQLQKGVIKSAALSAMAEEMRPFSTHVRSRFKIVPAERFTEPLLIDIKEMIDEEMQEWPGGKE
tara:strand:+ start:636 stop:977 length:342 start_codon:yes stop_codon:yes gene_type:complete